MASNGKVVNIRVKAPPDLGLLLASAFLVDFLASSIKQAQRSPATQSQEGTYRAQGKESVKCLAHAGFPSLLRGLTESIDNAHSHAIGQAKSMPWNHGLNLDMLLMKIPEWKF